MTAPAQSGEGLRVQEEGTPPGPRHGGGEAGAGADRQVQVQYSTVQVHYKYRYKMMENIFPAAQSVLICNREDFKAVMDFLFYSISVCRDRRLYDLMARTLFELRRNYSFRYRTVQYSTVQYSTSTLLLQVGAQSPPRPECPHQLRGGEEGCLQ